MKAAIAASMRKFRGEVLRGLLSEETRTSSLFTRRVGALVLSEFGVMKRIVSS